MAIKLVVNFLVIVNTLLTVEAMELGVAAGLDFKAMIEAIGSSFAVSSVFNFRASIMVDTYLSAGGGVGEDYV